MKNLVIAIDGPSASGKGTLAKKLANYFNLPYLNSGALYRALAWQIQQQNLDITNKNYLIHIDNLVANLSDDILENECLTTEKVGFMASIIAKETKVREALFFWQKDFITNSKKKFSGCVIDGRDIATVICPEADYKFFIKANVETRAKRRYQQLVKNDHNIKYEDILEQLKKRDHNDINRDESPLRIAQDAIIIDNSSLNIEETIDLALKHINKI